MGISRWEFPGDSLFLDRHSKARKSHPGKWLFRRFWGDSVGGTKLGDGIEQGTGEWLHAPVDRGEESIVHEDEVAPVGG